MTNATHTPGPLIEIRADACDDGAPYFWFTAGHGFYGDSVGGFGFSGIVAEDDARLVAAAHNSYRKHCGPNAIEAAENDLLGQALDALEETEEQLSAAGGYWESSDLLAHIRVLLAKAGRS